MDRRTLAILSWWAEFVTVVITLLYSAIALYDIRAGSPQYSSSAWYRVGFCIWHHESYEHFDSHTLCFIVDLILGSTLMYLNYRKWATSPKDSQLQDALIVATVISFFDVMHGFGHASMHLAPDLIASPVPLFSWLFVLKCGVAFNFLAVAPAVGYVFGVPKLVCVALHLVESFLFGLAPSKFGFGSVQLIINLWFCTPRVLWIGTESKNDIASRVDYGWACASIGNLLLMPVVFSEMMLCDTWLKSATGHFLYDFSTLLLTAAYSWAVWGEGDRISRGTKASGKTK